MYWVKIVVIAGWLRSWDKVWGKCGRHEVSEKKRSGRRKEGESDLLKKTGAAGLILRSAGHSPVAVTARNNERGMYMASPIQCGGGRYPSTPTYPPNPLAPDGTPYKAHTWRH